MLKRIIEIIAGRLSLDIDDVTLDSDVTGDLGADSLDIVQITDDIEKSFGIEVSDEDVMSVKTVADILDYLERRACEEQKTDILSNNQISW